MLITYRDRETKEVKTIEVNSLMEFYNGFAHWEKDDKGYRLDVDQIISIEE